jgi:hypothetical protein
MVAKMGTFDANLRLPQVTGSAAPGAIRQSLANVRAEEGHTGSAGDVLGGRPGFGGKE